MLQSAAERHNEEIDFSFFVLRDVTAACDAFAAQLKIDIVQDRKHLAGERDESWTIRALHCGHECANGFFGIGRANHVDTAGAFVAAMEDRKSTRLNSSH